MVMFYGSYGLVLWVLGSCFVGFVVLLCGFFGLVYFLYVFVFGLLVFFFVVCFCFHAREGGYDGRLSLVVTKMCVR